MWLPRLKMLLCSALIVCVVRGEKREERRESRRAAKRILNAPPPSDCPEHADEWGHNRADCAAQDGPPFVRACATSAPFDVVKKESSWHLDSYLTLHIHPRYFPTQYTSISFGFLRQSSRPIYLVLPPYPRPNGFHPENW